MGLRRRGPGLRPLLLLALTAAPLACFGLDEQEEARLTVHQQNSQEFYQNGAYVRALHQADMALQLDADLVGMRLLKGWCLTKIGKLAGRPERIDEAIVIFDDLLAGAGEDDYRTWLGAGQANLARALAYDTEIARIDRRLASDFLSPQGRRDEEANREAAETRRVEHLQAAEQQLRRVLLFQHQSDNPYALIELVSVLNSFDGTDDEAVLLAHKAIAQLQAATRITRNTLQKSLNIDPKGEVVLQRRIDENLEKERQLRGIIITIQYNRGAWQACLAEYGALEERQLMTPADHLNRAGILEGVGMYTEAIADLETYLRLRARSADYDDVAAEVFDRIEKLRVADPGRR